MPVSVQVEHTTHSLHDAKKRPRIVHVNDWQTGMVPAYLKIEYRRLPRYDKLGLGRTFRDRAVEWLRQQGAIERSDSDGTFQ